MRRNLLLSSGGVILLGLLGATQPAWGDNGDTVLQKDCSGCHNLTGPAPQNVQALWERKGPDLFYAGNKYRQGWLVSWLQKPVALRPAGEFYGRHILSTPTGDQVDPSGLKPHSALDKENAEAVAASLMKLKPHDDLINKEHIEPGSISRSMGGMVFDKFLGCIACHRTEPDYGGLSGPELYTAGTRLQPEFIASYIRSPQAWDPKIWMPNKHVTDANIQKLVRYLELLSKEDAHGQ